MLFNTSDKNHISAALPRQIKPTNYLTQFIYSWFQAFAVFCMFNAFFWVITSRLEFIYRRFVKLCLFHLHRHTCLWRWKRPSVQKCRHINSRRRVITQKKAFNSLFIVRFFIDVNPQILHSIARDCKLTMSDKVNILGKFNIREDWPYTETLNIRMF